MDNVTHLGLDVHKQTIAVGLLRPQDPLPDYRVIDNSPESIRKLVSKLGASSPLFACYEAEIMHGSLASKSLSSLAVLASAYVRVYEGLHLDPCCEPAANATATGREKSLNTPRS